jgi:hypothetical protein
LCLTLCLAWLATGCTGPSREAVLEPMIGEDIETAIQAFGPPAETVELDDGNRAYLWRRVYKYDQGRRARSWPERRLAGWTEEPGEPADARVCSTRLVTGFDLRIRSWDYGCETVIVDRRRAASVRDDDAVAGDPAPTKPPPKTSGPVAPGKGAPLAVETGSADPGPGNPETAAGDDAPLPAPAED